jgi:hypothetical protein
MLTAKNFIVGYLIASQTITSFREKNTDSAHIDTMAKIAILETDISQRIRQGFSATPHFKKVVLV